MNLANDGAKYGADQYRFAHNYDLASKNYIISAGVVKYNLAFTDRSTLTFDSGKGAESFEYECLKIEDDTYFVRFGTQIAAIELSQGLATLILPQGHVFGSIELPGQSVPNSLHSPTDEMIGTSVQWVLGCDKYVNHIYSGADMCRTAWSPDSDNFTDLPTKYVKIKDGIYLVDVEGAIPDNASPPSGSNRMIALQDYDHMMFVGCILGKAPPLVISGYGEFPEFDE